MILYFLILIGSLLYGFIAYATWVHLTHYYDEAPLTVNTWQEFYLNFMISTIWPVYFLICLIRDVWYRIEGWRDKAGRL